MSKKILIVEDELIIAKVLLLQLEKNGYSAQMATKVEDAIDKASKYIPDYIVMDVFLKNNGNGIDAAKAIRKLGINTPIIFTTGNSQETTQEIIKEITNCYLLIKPVEYYQIEEIICK